MSLVRNINVHDALGNPIGSVGGALNVHDADVHREIINRRFHRHTTPSTTLTVAAVGGTDYQITVASSTGFAVNDYVHIQNGSVELVHPQITAIAGNVLTLDRRVDNDHPIGTTVQKAIQNMIEVGTIAAPISYQIAPLSGEIWHLTKISIAMGHTSAGDLGTFGNIAGGLTNGVLLRHYDGTTGHFTTFTNWKTNGDIDVDTGGVKFPVRSGGGGTYGTSSIGLFSDAGAIVYLDGTAGDYIEILVQDDLSSLSLFIAEMQGHYE